MAAIALMFDEDPDSDFMFDQTLQICVVGVRNAVRAVHELQVQPVIAFKAKHQDDPAFDAEEESVMDALGVPVYHRIPSSSTVFTVLLLFDGVPGDVKLAQGSATQLGYDRKRVRANVTTPVFWMQNHLIVCRLPEPYQRSPDNIAELLSDQMMQIMRLPEVCGINDIMCTAEALRAPHIQATVQQVLNLFGFGDSDSTSFIPDGTRL